MNKFSYSVSDVIGERSHPKKTRKIVYSGYNKYWGDLFSFVEKEIEKDILAEQLWKNIILKETKRNFFRKNELKKLISSIKGDVIIDMGSGWGRYSSALVNNNIDKPIYALEYTEGGRKITKLLSQKYFDNQIKSYPFDYYNPDFSMVPEGSNVFVYSTYSIEQITCLSKQVFLNLIDRFDQVRGFHLEPVGWQFPEPHSRAEIKLKQKCLRVGYNTNFYQVLKELESEDKINIIEITRNFKSDRDDGTLVIWEKK